MGELDEFKKCAEWVKTSLHFENKVQNPLYVYVYIHTYIHTNVRMREDGMGGLVRT
jgi:hypothetical protein